MRHGGHSAALYLAPKTVITGVVSGARFPPATVWKALLRLQHDNLASEKMVMFGNFRNCGDWLLELTVASLQKVVDSLAVVKKAICSSYKTRQNTMQVNTCLVFCF